MVENSRFLCGIFIEQHLNYKLNEKEYKELSEDRLNKLLCKDVLMIKSRFKITKADGPSLMIKKLKFLSILPSLSVKNWQISLFKNLLKLEIKETFSENTTNKNNIHHFSLKLIFHSFE